MARGLYAGVVENLVITLILLISLGSILIYKKKYKILAILFAFFFLGNGFYFLGEHRYKVKDYLGVVSVVGRVSDRFEEGEHDAEVDAHNTMIEFKEILNKLGFSLIEIIELCPNVKDRTENFIVSSIKQNKENNEEIGEKTRKFAKKLIKIAVKYPERDNWPLICLSDSIRETTTEGRLRLIEAIFNAGYNYGNKVSVCSYFVIGNEYGERDLSCDHNIEDNKKDIKKITISELSKLIKEEVSQTGEIEEKVDFESPFMVALLESLKKRGITYEEYKKSFQEDD